MILGLLKLKFFIREARCNHNNAKNGALIAVINIYYL